MVHTSAVHVVMDSSSGGQKLRDAFGAQARVVKLAATSASSAEARSAWGFDSLPEHGTHLGGDMGRSFATPSRLSAKDRGIRQGADTGCKPAGAYAQGCESLTAHGARRSTSQLLFV